MGKFPCRHLTPKGIVEGNDPYLYDAVIIGLSRLVADNLFTIYSFNPLCTASPTIDMLGKNGRMV